MVFTTRKYMVCKAQTIGLCFLTRTPRSVNRFLHQIEARFLVDGIFSSNFALKSGNR
jgi:hypothetical protein